MVAQYTDNEIPIEIREIVIESSIWKYDVKFDKVNQVLDWMLSRAKKEGYAVSQIILKNILKNNQISNHIVKKWLNVLPIYELIKHQDLPSDIIEYIIFESIEKHKLLNYLIFLKFALLTPELLQKILNLNIVICENFCYLIQENPRTKWENWPESWFEENKELFDLEKLNKIRPFSKLFCLKWNLDSRWSK